MLLLILVPLLLLWLLVAVHRDRIGFAALSVRGALVLAFLAYELVALGVTELTSIGHRFTAGSVAVVWGVVSVALLVATRRQLAAFVTDLRRQGARRLRLRESLRVLSVDDRIWLVVLVAIFGTLVAVGSRYVPSNSDSLVYHLTRVEHWIQDRSISPFATHYLPQVGFAPLAEYNLALLHLLTGTDRFDAGVALTAAMISVVGASELARLLGASRSVQIAAAVVCATIPSGVLLATSTENDYFAAAIGIGLLIIAVSFSADAGWRPRAVALGAASGLAYMTKASIPLMLGPAALALVTVAFIRLRRGLDTEDLVRRVIAVLAVAGVAAVVVVGPFTVQNVELSGSPFGPASSTAASAPFTLQAGAANVVRSVANNFHIGNGSSGPEFYVAKVALGALSHVFDVLHVAQNDSHYSVTPGYKAFTVRDYSQTQRTETFGANPWEVVLLVASMAVLAVTVKKGARRLRISLLLALGLSAGYLLFTFIAKWGIWDARYSLPLLVAWSAVIAVALSRFSVWVTRIVLLVLVVACLPQLLDSNTRPLIPSASYNATYNSSYLEPYFASCCKKKTAGEMARAYEAVASALAQSTCEEAGIGNFIEFEYPLWVGLTHNHWNGELNNFDVHNQTTKLEADYRPCALVTQVGHRHVTPENGTVNLQFKNLALSINAGDASTVRTSMARFTSEVPGTRIFPGGGWSLAGFEHDPVLNGRGTLYLSSTSARPVSLHLRPAGGTHPSIIVVGPDGHVVPSVAAADIRATLDLHRGMNRIRLSAAPATGVNRRNLVLTSVSVTSAHP